MEAAVDGTLNKIAVTGGAPITLCPSTAPFGASWSDGAIVFATASKGIQRVSENGGTPETSCPRAPAIDAEPADAARRRRSDVRRGRRGRGGTVESRGDRRAGLEDRSAQDTRHRRVRRPIPSNRSSRLCVRVASCSPCRSTSASGSTQADPFRGRRHSPRRRGRRGAVWLFTRRERWPSCLGRLSAGQPMPISRGPRKMAASRR